MSNTQLPITEVIHSAGRGEDAAKAELYERVYEDLRKAARGILQKERDAGEMQIFAIHEMHSPERRILVGQAGERHVLTVLETD